MMKRKKISLILSGLLYAGATGLLYAGTMGPVAAEESPWLIRLRAIDVLPEASSPRIPVIGGYVTDISDQVTGELDFSYFFTKHISAELILATTRHSVKATGTAIGDVNLGKASVLPPTLTAQYHFFPEKLINPYLGVGINVTHFYDIDPGPVASSIDYDDTVGPALQAGADFALNKNWSINLDVKKVFIKPKVTVYTPVGALNTRVTIDPWIFGVGVGYRCD